MRFFFPASLGNPDFALGNFPRRFRQGLALLILCCHRSQLTLLLFLLFAGGWGWQARVEATGSTVALREVLERRAEDISEFVRQSLEAEWEAEDHRFRIYRSHLALPNITPPREQELPRFSLEHLEALIQRAEDLLRRRELQKAPADVAEFRNALTAWKSRIQMWTNEAFVPETVRREAYFAVRTLLRKIALSSALLDFDLLLFIKRHDPAGIFHMCDQYYGVNAVPGGGLFVLIDPWGEQPKLVNLLEQSVVEKGRLAGSKLSSGSFLSPEVDWDGKTIFFAYSEAKGWDRYRGKEAYEWSPEICYHIFRSYVDGSGVEQLTDGPWDDFDPCLLPDGRIAFISTRRGGYLRCGRHCPVYTLHVMEADGSNIEPLSFHETHEWNPSVTHDGMIVYTRWDYVDRDTNVAHHMWICYPDGRNPRAPHGNYPQARELRPWMQMQIRAIPGSAKFVAVAAAHHGHEFGSLVLIDPRIPDDGAMSQLERLTPDVPFPEAEGRPIRPYMVYGTPWPLSEEEYLVVYDPAATNRGIYWMDRWGNRELIYRDPQISCASPMPLRPRSRPPAIPAGHKGWQDGRHSPFAKVAVLNVYDSDFSWPPGTKITHLRIVQVLPKSTPPPNEPRIGVANQTNARAVLGTVPVEADGSAYFELPAGKLVYFQALDENGMAVMSMRSGTYFHPGESTSCQGCHEARHRAAPSGGLLPLALQRPPSPVTPPPEGANPFSFVRLVQPVLDKHCVPCHLEKNALDLRGIVEGPHKWTRSYTNLAPRYGFYYHVANGSINDPAHGGSRTIPGQFGARAAKLLHFLGPEHYGVNLPKEDLARITLWLDLNCEFFGAYEDTEAQAHGKVVFPSLE